MEEILNFREKHFTPMPEHIEPELRKYYGEEDILDRLAARYKSEPVPACRVCGGELSIQSMGGGNATKWGCAAPEGVSISAHMEHYQQSLWLERQAGDSEVLALVELVRTLQKTNEV